MMILVLLRSPPWDPAGSPGEEQGVNEKRGRGQGEEGHAGRGRGAVVGVRLKFMERDIWDNDELRCLSPDGLV